MMKFVANGPDCGMIPEVCANATQVYFKMSNLVHNNLVGKGPGGGPHEMKFVKVAVLGSREFDTIIFVKGNYKGPPSWNEALNNQAGSTGPLPSWNEALNNQAGSIGASQGNTCCSLTLSSLRPSSPFLSHICP